MNKKEQELLEALEAAIAYIQQEDQKAVGVLNGKIWFKKAVDILKKAKKDGSDG